MEQSVTIVYVRDIPGGTVSDYIMVKLGISQLEQSVTIVWLC